MPHLKKEVLINLLLKTYDKLVEVWADTKNFTHEQKLKKEIDRLEQVIRAIEKAHSFR